MTETTEPVEGLEDIDPSLLEAISSDIDSEKVVSIEELSLLITTDRIRSLEEKIQKDYSELKERQDKVRALNKLLKLLNKMTDDKGELKLELTEDLKALLQKAKELGVEVDVDKKKYKNAERELLVENIRTTIDDFNTENDLQLQMISKFTNERYETYHMVRSVFRPLHEDKINKARAVAGR